MSRRWWTGTLAGTIGALASAIAVAAPAGIDTVFAGASGRDRPGCALAVAQAGEVSYAKGYGVANLETGTAISPETIFDIGSVGKQFTAMAVMLLVGDGRLALADDVRRYLPELPDYGATITIADLLHHTSGLRDYRNLLDLAGLPDGGLTTRRDVLDLVTRQQGVDFPAGTEFLYSNTNYFLAGEIVRRVSGQSLREFAAQRIFTPLGMTRTHVSDAPREIVVGRAAGYEQGGQGYLNYLSNLEQVGDGSVLTTVLDLARWERNFASPKVGGAAAVAALVSPGALRDGTLIPYGLGLFIDRYRGSSWLFHGAESAGYRAALSRFPDQALSVIVACNAGGEPDPLLLGLEVADRYLGGAGEPVRAVADPGAELRAGLYWSPEQGTVRRFTVRDGVLVLGGGVDGASLEVLADGSYRARHGGDTHYRFPGGGPAVTWQMESIDYGHVARYYRMPPVDAERVTPADYAGRYRSPELATALELVVEGGELVRRQSYLHDAVLTPIFADTYVASLGNGDYLLHFVRDRAGRVTGLLVSGEQLRPMLLSRDSGAATR